MKKLFTLLFFTFCFCSMLRPSATMDVDERSSVSSPQEPAFLAFLMVKIIQKLWSFLDNVELIL